METRRWRCMVEGCDQYGIWKTPLPGEKVAEPSDPSSHYFRVHYVPQEAEYRRKVAEQQEARRAHYLKTGQFLPPTV